VRKSHPIELSDSDNIVQVNDVSKSYGSSKVLHEITFEIPRGSIFGLLGPNGAGKTTLIRALTGITAPDSGEIILQGKPQKPSIGYLPEERGLYRKMKVWEHAMYITRLKGLSKSESVNHLKPWFERLGMTDWLEKPIESLSKGMQQKLQFVITVANDPELLILDEPFSGFDPVNADEIKREILGLHEKGKTILLSTHNMASVEELCTNVCLINRGKLVLNDSLSSVKSTYRKSIFEVEFKGSKIAFANTLGHQFEVKEIIDNNDRSTALIQGFDNVKSNELLRALIQSVEVKSFSEKLPSMNDIFIDLVAPKLEIESSE